MKSMSIMRNAKGSSDTSPLMQSSRLFRTASSQDSQPIRSSIPTIHGSVQRPSARQFGRSVLYHRRSNLVRKSAQRVRRCYYHHLRRQSHALHAPHPSAPKMRLSEPTRHLLPWCESSASVPIVGVSSLHQRRIFLKGLGMERRLTTHAMSQHNGVEESLNRHLLERVCAILRHSCLPQTPSVGAIHFAM